MSRTEFTITRADRIASGFNTPGVARAIHNRCVELGLDPDTVRFERSQHQESTSTFSAEPATHTVHRIDEPLQAQNTFDYPTIEGL